MLFSSVALIFSCLAFSAQAGTIENNSTFTRGFNQYGVEIIGINDYYYDKNMKPTFSLEEQSKECGQGVTKCLGGPNYLKCVDSKWVLAKCRYEVQSCRKGAMSNQCSEY